MATDTKETPAAGTKAAPAVAVPAAVASINEALALRKVSQSEAMKAVVAANVKAHGPLPTKAYNEAQDWPQKDEFLTFKAGTFTDHLDDRVARLAVELKALGTCPQYSAALNLHCPNLGRRSYGRGLALAKEKAAEAEKKATVKVA